MLLRHALRSLRKSPGYAGASIAILALGIGANTAIFSLIYDAILKPLPYPDSNRLVLIYGGFPTLPEPASTHMPSSRLAYEEWRRQARLFDDIAAFHETQFREGGVERPRVLTAELVSANFLPLLSATPRFGRLFRADEEGSGADHVVVLSDRYFQQRFNGDPAAVGKSITFGGAVYTVIGVLPPRFALPVAMNGDSRGRPDVFIPLSRGWTRPDLDRQTILNVAARLGPGVTVEQAHAEIRAITVRLNQSDLERFPIKDAHVYTFRAEHQSADLNRALYVLLTAVGLVLLTGCANLANLTLARAARQSREIAVRRALGASRAHIVRQLLTESVLLSAAGALAGLLIAHWLTRGLLALAPADAVGPDMGALSLPVFLFAAGVAAATVLVFGLTPAISASNIDLNATLKSGDRGGSASGQKSRRFLIAAEVAMALVLVTGAGLLLRSFARVITTDLGFETERLVSVDIDLPSAEFPEPDTRARLLENLLERARLLPGVSAAAMSDTLPLHRVSLTSFDIAGRPPLPPGEFLTADYAHMTPNYLEILGVPLLAGRRLTAADGAKRQGSSDGVILVNRSFVDKFLPTEDPLQQRLRINDRWFAIVGVVADFRALGAEEDIRPQFFTPYLDGEFTILVLKSPIAVETLTAALRGLLGSIDERLAIARIRTMTEYVNQWLEIRWFGLVLITGFAGVALLLAMIGVHSVLANVVASRTREIGIRLALGATPGGIGRLIAVQSLRPIVIGLAVGLAGSLALGIAIRSMLFGIPSYDPLTFGGSVAAVLAAVPLAMWWPVRRATRVECTVALRDE